MKTSTVINLCLAAVSLFGITTAIPANTFIDQNHLALFEEEARVAGAKKAKEAGMSNEIEPTISAQTFTAFLSDQIKERIKNFKTGEVIGDIKPLKIATKDFTKEGKPEDFDLFWGTNYFIKIQAKIKFYTKEEDRYYHIRIFKGTHPDDFPRLVGIEADSKNRRSYADTIAPIGMFKEFQPDPMNLPPL